MYGSVRIRGPLLSGPTGRQRICVFGALFFIAPEDAYVGGASAPRLDLPNAGQCPVRPPAGCSHYKSALG